METMFNIPLFFQSPDDVFVLHQILKHYLDGTLPTVLTAYREHIEEWDGGYHVTEEDEACIRYPRGETHDAAEIAC